MKRLSKIASKVREVPLQEKIGKQDYHYEVKELFEPITEAATDTKQELVEESKSTTKKQLKH